MENNNLNVIVQPKNRLRYSSFGPNQTLFYRFLVEFTIDKTEDSMNKPTYKTVLKLIFDPKNPECIYILGSEDIDLVIDISEKEEILNYMGLEKSRNCHHIIEEWGKNKFLNQIIKEIHSIYGYNEPIDEGDTRDRMSLVFDKNRNLITRKFESATYLKGEICKWLKK